MTLSTPKTVFAKRLWDVACFECAAARVSLWERCCPLTLGLRVVHVQLWAWAAAAPVELVAAADPALHRPTAEA